MLRQEVEDSFAMGGCQQRHELIIVRRECDSWPIGNLRVHGSRYDLESRQGDDVVSEDVLQVARCCSCHARHLGPDDPENIRPSRNKWEVFFPTWG